MKFTAMNKKQHYFFLNWAAYKMKIDEEKMLMVFFILVTELIYVDNHAYWLKNSSQLVWKGFFAIIPLHLYTQYNRDREVCNELL